MHYRRLGRSGLKLSEIALGAWVTFGNQISEKTASQLVHAAYDAGINFFDNADVYASGQAEIVMGKAIKDLPREALVISSKVFSQTMPGPNGRGLSRKHITESVNASLKRLGIDYLDIYFCHRFDPDTPIDEVVYTMDTLIRQARSSTGEHRNGAVSRSRPRSRLPSKIIGSHPLSNSRSTTCSIAIESNQTWPRYAKNLALA